MTIIKLRTRLLLSVMLEFFTIFSKGGIVLWLLNPFKQDHIPPINSLIRDILLEGTIQNSYRFEKNTLEYKTNNEKELIFVAGYNSLLELPYIKSFLRSIEQKFVEIYKKHKFDQDYSNFDSTFNRELQYHESTFSNGPSPLQNQLTNHQLFEPMNSIDHNIQLQSKSDIIFTHEKFKKNSVKESKGKKINKAKTARVWDGTYTEKDAELLDFSDKPKKISKKSKKASIERPQSQHPQSLETKNHFSIAESRFYSFFKSLVSGTVITRENLEPVITKMKMHLFSKNVAISICDKICLQVTEKLIGQTVGSFGGISSLVNQIFEETLFTILTPKRDINVVNTILENKSGRPFVIVFCGVNGVGKSTNLAKIAYFLLNNNQRVLIAACDTFRSGAVEQLKVHVSRFKNIFPGNQPNCTLFERGYGKDSAAVAAEAIRIAKAEGYHVVLIDTAGRMQNNEPLMRSLAKLIKVNRPDLVLFVGECLVGNDGVDQLIEFDRHLMEYSGEDTPRGIDGIVLTKFDAVDDKVGTTLSMTYLTGQPIVFVGVGQTYNDLRVLDVKSVVNLLMK